MDSETGSRTGILDGVFDGVMNASQVKRKALIIDIETYGRTDLEDPFIQYKAEDSLDKRLKDPVKIEENRQKVVEKFALSPMTGRIILFGSLDTSTNEYEAYSGEEKDILEKAWKKIMWAYGNGYLIVSKGGKRFDIPYMFMRSVVNGINGIKGSCLLKNLLMKYNDSYHLDLETYFTEGGLYSWGYLMGFTDQFKNNGSEIKAMYEAGDMQQIADKNYEDLRLTSEVFGRIESWI